MKSEVAKVPLITKILITINLWQVRFTKVKSLFLTYCAVSVSPALASCTDGGIPSTLKSHILDCQYTTQKTPCPYLSSIKSFAKFIYTADDKERRFAMLITSHTGTWSERASENDEERDVQRQVKGRIGKKGDDTEEGDGQLIKRDALLLTIFHQVTRLHSATHTVVHTKERKKDTK